MASLTAFRQALTSEDLLQRFEAACLKSAAYITAEDPGSADHINRASWAASVISDAAYGRVTAAKLLRWAVATNATVQDAGPSSTDADIEYVLAVALGDPTTLAMVR